MIDGISGRPAGLDGASKRTETAGSQLAGTGKADAAAVAASPVEETRVELSPLAEAARDAASAPVDKARVAQLRAAIADGSYSVNPEKIAAKMVELDLGWTGGNGGSE